MPEKSISKSPKQKLSTQPSALNTPGSEELRFLVACCRAEPDHDAIVSQMEDGKWTPEDWERIISLAARHGVLPLLYKSLKSLLAARCPLPATH